MNLKNTKQKLQPILNEKFSESACRFATESEVKTDQFTKINKQIDKISHKYNLIDHSDINRERYPWAKGLYHKPECYAARLWEYPYALLSANLKTKMKCVDVGCGMMPFLLYLRDVIHCEAIGVDPDFFDSGTKNKAHGINKAFIKKTDLNLINAGMESIPLGDESVDRVFCISVIEHVPPDIARLGMQEMARILKPNGKLIVTVDVNMFSEINRPLDLIWESGLMLQGSLDLKWPFKRFGIFVGGAEPADVFGFTLVKRKYKVQTMYTKSSKAEEIEGHEIPLMRSISKEQINQNVQDVQNTLIDSKKQSTPIIKKIIFKFFKLLLKYAK